MFLDEDYFYGDLCEGFMIWPDALLLWGDGSYWLLVLRSEGLDIVPRTYSRLFYIVDMSLTV